jgi:hypothetical protein
MARQVSREQQSWEKRLWHLQARRFACEADAQAALTHSLKDLPAWFEVQATCLAHDHYEGKGRPAKETAPTQRWQCQATLMLSTERLAEEGRRRACFIVGTNVLDPAQLPDEELIGT